jgi:hypothetical protein
LSSGLITFLLVIHIVTASLWIGNALFLDFILNPSLRTLTLGHAKELAAKTGSQATILAWICILATATTGLIIAELLGQLNLAFLTSPSGVFLTLGIILTVSALANSSVITFVFIPRTKIGDVQIATRRIKMVGNLIRINIVIALAITVSMVILRGP